ncbi:gamma-glutamyltransferase [Terasakiella sp. A23]|uniref:gamma-glutamyltransferase n=1 Tax=Terasakiella sp. FCG-A23 TaxID=3080561 RepID=UPI0029530477|nr:gamma-glutamyltransferase [Terasakiella sp. A23]MDV7341154.1 gamma-glutamyltransferase [Terasakiella sp. A23]
MFQLFSYPILRRCVGLISGIIWLGACATDQQVDHRATPEAGGQWQIKSAVSAKKSMISVANPHAAQAGYRILRAGGNAIDAAIAAQLVLNLVEPQSSGIGGGGFLMMYDPKMQAVISFDGRETAPMTATPDLFIKEDGNKMGFFEAAVGGRAVGTPGLVHMLYDAHQKYGRISWPLLFDQAIRLAEKGFEVSERLHLLIKKDKFLKNDPVARAYFYQEDGTPLPVGHLLKNPAFADSLREIQKGGAAAFYQGKLADEIVAKVQSHPTNPGQLSFADMQRYHTVMRKPVCLTYRAYDVCGMAPPSSGGVTVSEILGLMEQYDLNNDPKPTIDRAHLLLEASKLAFADRNHFLADPDFVKVPTDELLTKSYLTGRQTLIQHDSALATPVAPGGPFLYSQAYAPHDTDHGVSTTHMSIVDADGMVVSMTTSIENAFGSRQMVGGFLLNNQLTDFSFAPEKNGVKVANRVEARKRPRSSMAPTIVLDHKTQKPVLAIGSPGGSRIIGYVAQSLIAILDDKLPLDQALMQGHLTNRNGSSDLEKGTEAVVQKAKLEALGHKVNLKEMTSGLHAIQILPDGTLIGAADPRREGAVNGF